MNLMLCLTDFFKQLQNIIIVGLIAVIVVVCAVILTKTAGGRQILLYILASVIVVGGIFHGVKLVKEVTSQSYIVGDITVENAFELENFSYKTNTVAFSEKNEIWSYNLQFLPLKDFNGQKYDYSIVVNDYILPTETSAGSASTKMNIEFYSTVGELEHSATLNIKLEFYVDKTTMLLTTTTLTQASYIEKYISTNGFKIKVIQGGEK